MSGIQDFRILRAESSVRDMERGDKAHSRDLYDGDNECEMKFGELCHLMKHDSGAVTAASANF